MNKQKLLLVEDEPSLTTMYQTVFRDSPFELLTAQDAKTAYDLTLVKMPVLILLDVILPKAEGKIIEFNKRVGFDLLAKIRKEKKIKDIPVMVLTNLDSPEDRIKAAKLGIIEYVVKANYLPKEIVAKVEKFLAKRKK